MLEVSGVTKTFGGIRALSGLELSLEQGDLTGLIGPNGAGKTTALNVLSGILRPSSGTIRFMGRDILSCSPEERSVRGISRTFQSIRLFDEMTVLQNVKVGAHVKWGASLLSVLLGLPQHKSAERRITEIAYDVLERTRMADFARTLAGSLSFGDRRRVEIARAMACDPKLLLLDEPAAGMNASEQRQLSDLILSLNQDSGLTLLLIEHHVPMVAQLCNKLVVLHKGETIASGKTQDVLRDQNVIDIYLGKRNAGKRPAASC